MRGNYMVEGEDAKVYKKFKNYNSAIKFAQKASYEFVQDVRVFDIDNGNMIASYAFCDMFDKFHA